MNRLVVLEIDIIFRRGDQMATIMNWTDQFKLGVEAMDDQHFELINRVNRLIIAHDKEENCDSVEELLTFLKSYVVKHFGDEERLQSQYLYPDYDDHRKVHAEFVKVVEAFEQAFIESLNSENENDCKVLLFKINNHLVEWLTHHINESDRLVAEHIQKVIKIDSDTK